MKKILVSTVSAILLAMVLFANVLAAPDPNWDKSSVKVGGACVGGEIVFTIRNTGESMQGSTNYIVYEGVKGQNPIDSGTVWLAEGGVATLTYSGEGKLFLAVYQRPGHPGSEKDMIAWADAGPCISPTPMVSPTATLEVTPTLSVTATVEITSTAPSTPVAATYTPTLSGEVTATLEVTETAITEATNTPEPSSITPVPTNEPSTPFPQASPTHGSTATVVPQATQDGWLDCIVLGQKIANNEASGNSDNLVTLRAKWDNQGCKVKPTALPPVPASGSGNGSNLTNIVILAIGLSVLIVIFSRKFVFAKA